MSERNGSGIEYPKITLGGVEYELRVTRGVLLYEMSRKGISVSDLKSPTKKFACLVDVLHGMIGEKFEGSTHDLATLVLDEEKVKAVDIAVHQALGKVFPSTQAPAAADVAPALN